MSHNNPKSVNEAIVGAWPRWLGKSWVSRALCRCGLHTWWQKPERIGGYTEVICSRCSTGRGW